MKIRLYTVVVILLLGLACDRFDSAEVDQGYLESESFAQFQRQVTFEQQRKAYKNAPIEKHLQDMANCSSANQLPLPLRIDSAAIDTLSSPKTKCIVQNRQMTISLIAETVNQKQRIGWVLVDFNTSYQDQRLVIALFENDQLQSFGTVGTYKTNLAEDISSEIVVNRSSGQLRISTKTLRQIRYPIEQQNTIEKEYQIDTNGNLIDQ